MTLLAAVKDDHHGRIGADFANCSARPVRCFIVVSMVHDPSVSESLTNRRMINIVKRSMII